MDLASFLNQTRRDLMAANIDPNKYVPRAGYFRHTLDCKECTGFTNHYFSNGRWWCSGCHQQHPSSRSRKKWLKGPKANT